MKIKKYNPMGTSGKADYGAYMKRDAEMKKYDETTRRLREKMRSGNIGGNGPKTAKANALRNKLMGW
jgi:hypothetical protein